MAKEFDVGALMLQQIAQSLLEVKKMGRSCENTADALLPLTDDVEVRAHLRHIVQAGEEIARQANAIYHCIAREAGREVASS